MAAMMQSGERQFRYLDAAQLLKHALGLQTHAKERFTLMYLYLAVAGDVENSHTAEIAEFSAAIRGDFPFLVLTYQTLFARLSAAAGPDHSAYFAYISRRYLGAAAN
jgi:hypothetical protein